MKQITRLHMIRRLVERNVPDVETLDPDEWDHFCNTNRVPDVDHRQGWTDTYIKDGLAVSTLCPEAINNAIPDDWPTHSYEVPDSEQARTVEGYTIAMCSLLNIEATHLDVADDDAIDTRSRALDALTALADFGPPFTAVLTEVAANQLPPDNTEADWAKELGL